MAQASAIEWTGSTWNPVVGCTKISTGCRHCYAERMARRLAAIAEAAHANGRNPGRAANYRHVLDTNGRWNDQVYLDQDAVADPLGWRSPRVVFVNSMSDLFHEAVPFQFIARVFDVMNACQQHTFQVLTKRPQLAASHASKLRWTDNIWMGATVENALVAHRVRELRNINAKVRFLSLEPLLGPLPRLSLEGIDWVILGGESGPGARAMQPAWTRQVRDRCLARSVPFFFKQWGGVNKKKAGRELDGRTWDDMPREQAYCGGHNSGVRLGAS